MIHSASCVFHGEGYEPPASHPYVPPGCTLLSSGRPSYSCELGGEDTTPFNLLCSMFEPAVVRMEPDLKDSVKWATKPEEAEQNRQCMSPRFRSACIHLGMSSEALYWWERIHVHSEAATLCYYSAHLLACAVYICLFFGAPASGPYSYAFKAPSLVPVLTATVPIVGWWRFGHGFHD